MDDVERELGRDPLVRARLEQRHFPIFDLPASEDGGRLVRDDVIDEIRQQWIRPSIGHTLGWKPMPPLTRREKLRGRVRRGRRYLRHLGLAIVDRCDRGDFDY